MRALVGGQRPDETWVGIGLAISSVIVMPMLGIAKQRLADQLGSAATKGEGRQNMLCAYLAGALLVGLLGNALAGAWWLDPAVGLLIAARGGQGGPGGLARRGLLRRRPARRRARVEATTAALSSRVAERVERVEEDVDRGALVTRDALVVVQIRSSPAGSTR